jgi:eukaryotic-like serine/threonine-protein kinase
MTSSADFNAACGHSVPRGAAFCPVCGQPVPAGPSPSPSAGPSPPAEPSPWPWQISDDDDDLHAVRSDPTVVPPYQAQAGPGQSEPPRSGRRRLALLIVGGVAVLVIVAVGVVLLTRHPGKAVAAPTHAATRAATPTASPSPDLAQLRATPEGTGAVALAGLLQQAATQLGHVSSATTNVRDCGSQLKADAATFYSAAGDRRRLLSDLSHLTGRAALSAALVRDLTGDWSESNTQYTDLGRWADYAIYRGCVTREIGSNADLRDSYGPGDQATADKEAFTRLWDPVASKYALPTYQYWQL